MISSAVNNDSPVGGAPRRMVRNIEPRLLLPLATAGDAAAVEPADEAGASSSSMPESISGLRKETAAHLRCNSGLQLFNADKNVEHFCAKQVFVVTPARLFHQGFQAFSFAFAAQFFFEEFVEGGQDQQGKRHGGEQSADDDDGDRALALGADAG